MFQLRSVYKHLFIKYKFWKDHSIYCYFETQIARLWCSTTQFYGNILYMSQFGLLSKNYDSHSYIKLVIFKIVGPFRYYFLNYANLWNWCVIFPTWIIFKVSFLMFLRICSSDSKLETEWIYVFSYVLVLHVV